MTSAAASDINLMLKQVNRLAKQAKSLTDLAELQAKKIADLCQRIDAVEEWIAAEMIERATGQVAGVTVI